MKERLKLLNDLFDGIDKYQKKGSRITGNPGRKKNNIQSRKKTTNSKRRPTKSKGKNKNNDMDFIFG